MWLWLVLKSQITALLTTNNRSTKRLYLRSLFFSIKAMRFCQKVQKAKAKSEQVLAMLVAEMQARGHARSTH
jgi:hypothetical protein